MQPLQDHEPEERGPDVYGVSKLADILEGKQSAIEFSLKGFIGIKLGKNGLAEGSVDTKSRGDIYVRAVETQKTVLFRQCEAVAFAREVLAVFDLAVDDARLIRQQCVEELVLESTFDSCCTLHDVEAKVGMSERQIPESPRTP